MHTQYLNHLNQNVSYSVQVKDLIYKDKCLFEYFFIFVNQIYIHLSKRQQTAFF